MTNLPRIRVVVLGSSRVGKSAVTVRYLTKRYIGEYSSTTDLLYRHQVSFDGVNIEVEILDTCKCKVGDWLFEQHVRWAEAFVVVYSVCDEASFREAQLLLDSLNQLRHKSSHHYCLSTLLLANKRDLQHSKAVSTDQGQKLSLQYDSCQFYKVSAAESEAGVTLAFNSLLRQARLLQLLRAAMLQSAAPLAAPLPPAPLRRSKLGAVNSVSKVLGNIFFGGGQNKRLNGKKRPSLSI